MTEIDKKMCKLAKEGLKKKEEEALFEEVCHPRYYCTKCLRVAAHKERLCKPRKLP